VSGDVSAANLRLSASLMLSAALPATWMLSAALTSLLAKCRQWKN
jgi:hypothetical protein